jgi:hypothetical protein
VLSHLSLAVKVLKNCTLKQNLNQIIKILHNTIENGQTYHHDSSGSYSGYDKEKIIQ